MGFGGGGCEFERVRDDMGDMGERWWRNGEHGGEMWDMDKR